ncbi:MAG: hypothetical protein WBK91_00160 [Alphaproteobacteria bacterium]
MERTASGHKFVPDVRASFAENADDVARKRNPFSSLDQTDLSIDFMQTYRAVAGAIYEKMTAQQTLYSCNLVQRQLKALFHKQLQVKAKESGADLANPEVRHNLREAAARNVSREIGICRQLARDYKARRSAYPLPPRNSGRAQQKHDAGLPSAMGS